MKNGLSAYLKLAKGRPADDDAMEEYLREGARSGKLIRAARRKSVVRLLMKNIAPTRIDWKAVLEQVREDRKTL